MKNKLLLLLAVLATLLVAVFAQSDFAAFLLGFWFLLEIALFSFTRVARRCLKKTVQPPPAQCSRDTPFSLTAALENRMVFPVPRVRVTLCVRDEYDGSVRRMAASAVLRGRGTAQLSFSVKACHYGLLTVRAEAARIFDPLGINGAVSRFPDEAWQIAVLPALPEEADANAPDAARAEGEGEASGFGGERGDAYELREYRTGEPLRAVHWKLSAKTGVMTVKEYEQQHGPTAALLLDTDCGASMPARAEFDRFLEETARAAAAWLRGGVQFTLFWLDETGARRRYTVRDRADACAALTQVLRSKPRDCAEELRAYKEQLADEGFAETVCIDLKGARTRQSGTR